MPRLSRACPPGVWCMSGGLIVTLFVTVFILCALLYHVFRPMPMMMPRMAPMPPAPITMIQQGGDSRYDRAPQPLRDWIGRPEMPPIGALPINIPTQGLPESFQSVGVIQAGDQILPLYGRRTLRGSDRWNYYTRTDTYNPVPLPVHFQRRDCMDDVGCQEILSGETVKIDALHKEGKTNIYRFDGPKYIPGLL
jgi:Family of unknown function (DUF5755)